MPLSSDRGITLFYYLRIVFFLCAFTLGFQHISYLYIGITLLYVYQLFVLIVSSCISRNRYVMRRTTVCYEHWADADISFWQRKRPPDVCLHFSIWLRYTLLFSMLSFPDHPAPVSVWKRYPFHGSLRLWWLAAIVEPFLRYFSNDSLQRHLKDISRKAWWWQRLELSRLLWGGWLISTLLVMCS